MKQDARYTAAQALLRQREGDAYSNLVMDALTAQNRLDSRDAAFAQALFYGTLERRLTIDHILRRLSAKPLGQLSPAVLASLRMGVCQLCWMDGVDDYAAVNESVNLVRELGEGRAAGFVNGVLRSFLRSGKEIPPADRPGQAAAWEIQYSCPEPLITCWVEAYGPEATLRLLEGSLGKPPTYLRANTLRVSARELCARLEEEGVQASWEETLEGCVLAQGRVAVEKLSSFAEGLFHVQDRASQLCVQALEVSPGQRVLDVCAAPGGKSFTIAQRMENHGELVARDLHPKRANLVARGAERLGINILRASAGDASVYDPALGSFDRVLCDVPCSGYGVIRRKPEIKYKPLESVEKLPQIQYKILETSANYLKPAGKLVYSTCTLLPRENEQVVERFLQGHEAFSLVRMHSYTGEEMDTDGFFVAVLTRKDG